MRVSKKTRSLREGFAYQDYVAARFVLETITPGSDVLRVWIESETGKHVDDIQVERFTEMQFYQVKYAVKRSAAYSFADLLQQKTARSRSILQKFADSWRALKTQDKPVTLHLYGNRIPSGEKHDLEDALDGTRLRPSFLTGHAFEAVRNEWLEHTGFSNHDLEQFVDALVFGLKQPELEELEAEIERQLRFLGIPVEKHSALLRQCQKWARERRDSIEAKDVRRLLGLPKNWGDMLSQEFPVEEAHFVPLKHLQEQLDTLITTMEGGYIVLTGKPGSGKSTFLQQYAEYREREFGERIIEYYCFVDINDPWARERASADAFIRSMIRQLHEEFPEIFQNYRYYERSAEKFVQMLQLLSQRVVEQKAKKVVMIVDGLDHVERLGREVSTQLLSEVLPHTAPQGIIFIVSAQAERYLPSFVLRDSKASKLTVTGFDLEGTAEYLLQRRRVPEVLERSAGSTLTELQVEGIHRKTEGLPLYLRYLAEDLLTGLPNDIDAFLERQPSIEDGDIGKYHQYIWDEVASDSKTRYLLTALALMRFRVPDRFLLDVVSDQINVIELPERLQSISHLLDIDSDQRTYRIFHNSFKELIFRAVNESHALWLVQLTRSVFKCLRQDEQSPLALAHLFYYARGCEEYDFVLTHANLEFVNRCIEAARPLPEIQDNLKIAIDAAVKGQNLVRLVELGLLADYTACRFEYDTLDRARLHITLLEMGRVDDVLESISYNYRLYGNPNTLLDLVAALPLYGAEEAGWRLFKRLRKEMSSLKAASHDVSYEPELTKYVRALAVYGYEPLGVIEWIRGIRWEWERETKQRQAHLLRSYIHSLGEYGDRELLAVIREQSNDEAVRSLAASEEIETMVAEGLVAEAQEVLRQTFPLSAVPQDGDLHLAYLAVRCRLPVEEVKRYLGSAQGMPNLDRERIHHEVSGEIEKFRKFVFVLSYCDAAEELAFICTELNKRQTWYAVCLRTAFDLAVVEGKWAAKVECDYARNLMDALGQVVAFQPGRDGTQTWDETYLRGQASRLCSEISTFFLKLFPDRSQELTDKVATLCLSKLLNLDTYLVILEDLAAEEPCQAPLRDVLPGVAERINEVVLEGPSRSRAYLCLAGIAARCREYDRAEEWLRLGIQASHCHGYHEDPVLDRLTASMSAMNALDPMGALERCVQVGELLRWLSVVTDMDDISFIPLNFLEEVSRVNLEAGFHLLEALKRDWGTYLISYCIRILARVLAPSDPVLAWEMVEILTGSGYGGDELKDNVNVKIQVVREACKTSHPMAVELAERAKIAILTDLTPGLRTSAVKAYNALAADYPELAAPIQYDWTEGDDAQGVNIPSRVRDIRIEIDDREVDLDQLEALASLSWEDFQRITRHCVTLSDTPYDVISRLRGILIQRFIPKAHSRVALEEIERFVDETGIGDTGLADESVFAALADRSRESGLTSLFIQYTLRHLEHTYLWRHYYYGREREEEVKQRFLALARYDPGTAIEFMYESLGKMFGEKTYGAPEAVGKLCQLLPELGLANQVPPIYDAFLSFCQRFFASLPPLDEKYTWLGDFQPTEATPASLVTRFLLERLAWPEYKVRERAIISLFRLSQTHASQCLPAVIDSLSDPDYSIRIGAMAAVDALASYVPDVLHPWVSNIKTLLESNHLVLVDMAEYALSRLDGAESGLHAGEWTRRIGDVALPRRAGTLHFPMGTGREAKRIIEQIPAAKDHVELIARVLQANEELVTTKVGLELKKLGYSEDEVSRRDREIYDTFYDRVEGMFCSPFEPRLYYMLRHAILRVAQDLIQQLQRGPWSVEFLRSHFRRFDPALPNLHIVPRPEEIVLDFGIDPNSWIEFKDIQQEIGKTSVESEWAVIFEDTQASRDRQQVDTLRFVCLIDPDVTPERCQTALNSAQCSLRMLAPQDYGELPIHVAQHFALLSPWPLLDPTGFHPMLCMHIGNWALSGGPYCLVTLVKPLIVKYSLDWCSPTSLNLHRNGEEVIRVITWRDGYQVTGKNIFWPASRGTLLQVKTLFLDNVAKTEGKRLFEVSFVTRTVKKERYRPNDQDRVSSQRIGRLVLV